MATPTLAGSIKIGFNVPLTGFAAADGNSALVGAQLAVEQVNGAGGINGDMLELVVYDDQASPKESAPLAVKLITQDEVVAGISGSYVGPTRAAPAICPGRPRPHRTLARLQGSGAPPRPRSRLPRQHHALRSPPPPPEPPGAP